MSRGVQTKLKSDTACFPTVELQRPVALSKERQNTPTALQSDYAAVGDALALRNLFMGTSFVA